jgi:tRNA A-37 threonylcarbamoyl transferase component Bud32
MTLPGKLGRYEIRRELGTGAMAVVYEGWDPSIQRRVAIKTIRRDQLDSAEADEVIARFEREAQAAGRLSHPNIVSIYEIGEDGGVAFIAMEFIAGRELKDYFDKNERFSLPEIAWIMTQLLDALDHAHRNGVVHRDIKPGNIILLADGTVKVADFGIARIESSSLTQAGIILGTPAYMSPEQFMGQTLDGRSDLFSAGVVLYQFLTSEKPFAAAQTSTIMHKVLKEDPPAPSEINVQVPRQFDALMRKALAKRPDERFQSAREFADEVRAAAASHPAEAVPAIAVSGGDSTMFGADATIVRRGTGPAAKAGSKTALVAGSVIALAAIVAGAFLALGPKQDAPMATQPAPASPQPVAAPPQPVAETNTKAFDPVNALDQVFEGRDRNHLVTVLTEKARIRIGRDPLRFRISSAKGGHVYVLMVGTDRNHFNLLFPNAIDDNNRVASQEELKLPRPGWAMTAGGPPGTNHFVAIVSESPRDFTDAGLRRVDPFGEFPPEVASRIARSRAGSPTPFAGKPVCKAQGDCPAGYGAATFSIDETQ